MWKYGVINSPTETIVLNDFSEFTASETEMNGLRIDEIYHKLIIYGKDIRIYNSITGLFEKKLE